MKYKNIIWDWNGTILDDAYIAYEATDTLLKKYGYPQITYDYYRDNMDTPIENFYSKIFDLNKESMDKLNEEWGVLYNMRSQTLAMHRGVDMVLSAFRDVPCRQVVLSAFQTVEILSQAERFDIADYFEEILGTESLQMESKTVRGKRYMQQNKMSPDCTLYIGDTVHDFETAKALGVDCLLISCGQQSVKMLQKCDAPIFENYAQIRDYLINDKTP